LAGYGLYLLDGKPVFHYNLAGAARYQVTGGDKLPAGTHTVVPDFKYDGGIAQGGIATLTVDGQKAAASRDGISAPRPGHSSWIRYRARSMRSA